MHTAYMLLNIDMHLKILLLGYILARKATMSDYRLFGLKSNIIKIVAPYLWKAEINKFQVPGMYAVQMNVPFSNAL